MSPGIYELPEIAAQTGSEIAVHAEALREMGSALAQEIAESEAVHARFRAELAAVIQRAEATQSGLETLREVFRALDQRLERVEKFLKRLKPPLE